MKRILTIEVDETEGDVLNRAVHADDAYRALWDITSHLRSEVKFNVVLSEEIKDYVDNLREKVYGVLEECNINLDRDYL